MGLFDKTPKRDRRGNIIPKKLKLIKPFYFAVSLMKRVNGMNFFVYIAIIFV